MLCRWQDVSTDRDSRASIGAHKPPPPARSSGGGRGPPSLRGRGGGRSGGRGAPPDRWDGGGGADRWEHNDFEGGPPSGREMSGHPGPPDDRWDPSGSWGFSGGGRGQKGREREEHEIYPAPSSQGAFRSQAMMVPVPPVVAAGPYGIYGGLAAGQLGFAPLPMAGRAGAFSAPMRGRGPRPPPGAPLSGRGRGRW